MKVDAMRDRLLRKPWVKLAVLLAHAGLGLAAMLAFSGCSFHPNAGPSANFNPGPTPQSHVVFCDIEQFGTGFDNTSRVCADQFIGPTPVPLTSAALALNNGGTAQFALDKSAAAVGRCGSNGEVVQFQGQFPQGTPVCLNCGAQIPAVYADGNAVCIARCEDISQAVISVPPPAAIATFCGNHAAVSTNVPAGGCPMGFDNACSDAGAFQTTFPDPRILPEPMIWTQLTNVATSGPENNTLTQTVASTPPGQYQAQAVSQQQLGFGDAYIEFSSGETTTAKVIGFSAIAQSCNQCTDSDPSDADINFSVNLASDGRMYVLHNNTLVPGGDVNNSFTTYAPGDRFRITVTDQNDGTFVVVYSKLALPCTPGLPCNLTTLLTDTVHGTYPIRVDTSLRDVGASLSDVTLVWIHQ
jgi:hypothetical protein